MFGRCRAESGTKGASSWWDRLKWVLGGLLARQVILALFKTIGLALLRSPGFKFAGAVMLMIVGLLRPEGAPDPNAPAGSGSTPGSAQTPLAPAKLPRGKCTPPGEALCH